MLQGTRNAQHRLWHGGTTEIRPQRRPSRHGRRAYRLGPAGGAAEPAVPAGARYLIDAFAEQRNDPSTDHGFLVNLMPEPLMSRVVSCLNDGVACDDTTTKRSAP